MKKLFYLLVLLLAACGKEEGMISFPNNDIDLRRTLNNYGGKIPGSINGEPASGISGDFFNEKANINKFSRKKPYIHPSMFPLSDQDIRNINFGMNPIDFGAAQVPGWDDPNEKRIWGQWQPPKGGTGQWLRISDYDGYNPIAVEHIREIKFYNSITPSKIPVVMPGGISGVVSYTTEIELNTDADIFLSEFNNQYLGSLSNMFLTLIIGANMGGLTTTESMFVQSEETIGSAISLGSSKMFVTMDTSTPEFKAMLDINMGQNIIMACLAPRWGRIFDTYAISLQMWGASKADVIYNERYATFGDGGEGGSRPYAQIYGHVVTGRVDNKPEAEVTTIGGVSSDGVIRVNVQGYPSLWVTNGANAGVAVSLAIDYVLTNIGTGQTWKGKQTFTNEQTVSAAGNAVTFVDPPEGSGGVFGIAIPISNNMNAGSYRMEYKYTTNQRPASTSAPSIPILSSDGQYNGLESALKSENFTIYEY